jgi:hypothetical protein
MLSDDEMISIAKAYAFHYAAGNGVKPGEVVAEPTGLWFQVDYIYAQCGDAGFFVSRVDGRVVQFGSGSFLPCLLAGLDLSTEKDRATAKRLATTKEGAVELLGRILPAILMRPAPAPDSHGLRVSYA